MSDFSHIPEIGDRYPIEAPPDGSLDKILGAIGDFFTGLGRKIDHIFTSHYCECVRFEVSAPQDVTIPAHAGDGAAIGKRFTVTADFKSDGTECACCQYRQFVRGYAVQLGRRVAGPPFTAGVWILINSEKTDTRFPPADCGHEDIEKNKESRAISILPPNLTAVITRLRIRLNAPSAKSSTLSSWA